MKNFVKGVHAFNRLKVKFPKLIEAKLKEGIFVGAQKRLLKDPTIDAKLISLELVGRSSIRAIVLGFLGNRKDDNYVSIVNDLLESYKSCLLYTSRCV